MKWLGILLALQGLLIPVLVGQPAWPGPMPPAPATGRPPNLNNTPRPMPDGSGGQGSERMGGQKPTEKPPMMGPEGGHGKPKDDDDRREKDGDKGNDAYGAYGDMYPGMYGWGLKEGNQGWGMFPPWGFPWGHPGQSPWQTPGPYPGPFQGQFPGQFPWQFMRPCGFGAPFGGFGIPIAFPIAIPVPYPVPLGPMPPKPKQPSPPKEGEEPKPSEDQIFPMPEPCEIVDKSGTVILNRTCFTPDEMVCVTQEEHRCSANTTIGICIPKECELVGLQGRALCMFRVMLRTFTRLASKPEVMIPRVIDDFFGSVYSDFGVTEEMARKVIAALKCLRPEGYPMMSLPYLGKMLNMLKD